MIKETVKDVVDKLAIDLDSEFSEDFEYEEAADQIDIDLYFVHVDQGFEHTIGTSIKYTAIQDSIEGEVDFDSVYKFIVDRLINEFASIDTNEEFDKIYKPNSSMYATETVDILSDDTQEVLDVVAYLEDSLNEIESKENISTEIKRSFDKLMNQLDTKVKFGITSEWNKNNDLDVNFIFDSCTDMTIAVQFYGLIYELKDRNVTNSDQISVAVLDWTYQHLKSMANMLARTTILGTSKTEKERIGVAKIGIQLEPLVEALKKLVEKTNKENY